MKVLMFFAGALAGSLTATADALPEISAANEFRGFHSTANAAVTVTDEAIVLTDIHPDCQLRFNCSRFFSTAADRVTIRYRASGTGKSSGELYFSGGRPYTDDRSFGVPSLIPDGQWHELVLTEKNLRNRALWLDEGVIERIRLDPVNGSGGRVEIASIRFGSSKDAAAVRSGSSKTDAEFLRRHDAPKWPTVESVVPLTNGVNLMVGQPDNQVRVSGIGGMASPLVARAGETVELIYDFSDAPPKGDIDGEVVLTTVDNTEVWRETVHLESRRHVVRLSERQWRIRFDYRLPLYIDTRELRANFSSRSIVVTGGTFPAAELTVRRVDAVPGFERPSTLAVREVGGYPTFVRDGKPFFPVWGKNNGRMAMNPNGTPWMSTAPYDLVFVSPDFHLWWPRGEILDTAEFDHAAEIWRRAVPPDCQFIWDLVIYPPQDWAAANPGEMCRDEEGVINRDGGSHNINFSFASQKAREAMAKMLNRAIDYLERSPYANRIAGYRVNSGHTIEWLGWEPMQGRTRKKTETDFSDVAQASFERFARVRYPWMTDFSVPTLAERLSLDEGSLLWDAKKHVRCVAYNNWISHEVLSFAMDLCGGVKRRLAGRKVVGTYYGYSMTLFDGGNQMRAHYAVNDLLQAKEKPFDFLASPAPYRVRGLGDPNGEMKAFASLQRAGIVPVLEDDTRTHLHVWDGYKQVPTEEQAVQIVRRDLGTALCRRELNYMFPINDGVNFGFAQFGLDYARFAAAATRALEQGVGRHAEIAVVVSEEAINGMPRGGNFWDRYDEWEQEYKADGTVLDRQVCGLSVCKECYQNIYQRIARLGAPVDYVLAEDLAHARDYKLYVFSNCSKTTPVFRKAVARLHERACTLVWSHAPGFVSDRGNGVENMRELTGLTFERLPDAFDPQIRLADGTTTGGTGSRISPLFAATDADETLGTYVQNGRPAYVVKRTGRATTIFSGSYRLERPLLQDAARRAGVWTYTDANDPVEANDAFFLLHARFPGVKRVRLPKVCDVVDVFRGEVLARGVSEFSFDAPLHSSRLFYYGDDADGYVKAISNHK